MKLYILTLTALLFVACSGGAPANNSAPDKEKIERNKQIAAKNEVTEITTTAQKLEKLGREMEILRRPNNPESQRECGIQMDDAQKQVKDLEARVNNLPKPYSDDLAPVLTDLNACVSCAKTTAMESCVKSRAAINDAIRKLYP